MKNEKDKIKVLVANLTRSNLLSLNQSEGIDLF